MTTTSRKTKIVIAGGGFAGLSAAMYLDRTLALEWKHGVTWKSKISELL